MGINVAQSASFISTKKRKSYPMAFIFPKRVKVKVICSSVLEEELPEF